MERQRRHTLERASTPRAAGGERTKARAPARHDGRPSSIADWSIAARSTPSLLNDFDTSLTALHAAIDLAAIDLATPVQRDARGENRHDPAAVHRAARAGTRGSGGGLPHVSRIQAAFGRHDVTRVRAFSGGAASAAASAMGARAFATGDAVAFGESPDLHTAAHEAAHVVQQRSGVSLAGGVGQAGDRYERHADEVADAVVAGRSAEAVLDRMTRRAAHSEARPALQCKAQHGSSAAKKDPIATWQKLSKQHYDFRVWASEIAQAYGFSLSTAGLVITAIENSGGLWIACRNFALAHALATEINNAAMKYPRAPWLVADQIRKIADWAKRFGDMATFVKKDATAIKVLGAIAGGVGLAVDVAGVIGGTDAVIEKVVRANACAAAAKATKAKLKKSGVKDQQIKEAIAAQVQDQLGGGEQAKTRLTHELRTDLDNLLHAVAGFLKEFANYAHGMVGAATGALQLASLISPATLATLGVGATVASVVNYLVQNLGLISRSIDYVVGVLPGLNLKGEGIMTFLVGIV